MGTVTDRGPEVRCGGGGRAEWIPTWSQKRTSPFSAFALDRIVGQISSCRTRTASGACSTARLSGRWKVGPQHLR